MDTKSMTRKEFVTLTFTLLGGAATAAACSSSSSSTGTGGTNGAGGTNAAGPTGGACTDPLPETQDADTSGHMHTVTVHASLLTQTTDQTLATSGVMNNTVGIADHTHTVVFTAQDLATLLGGGSVDVMSGIAVGHTHNYRVSCHAAGTGAAGSNAAAGTNGAAGGAGAAGASGTAGANGAAGINGAAGH